MSKPIAQKTPLIHIDEAGLFKLKGKQETDHNSIIVEVELPTATKITKDKITNFKDEEGWQKFNQIIEEQLTESPPANYNQYEKAVKDAIQKSFKTITVNKGKYKYKKTEIAKKTEERKKRGQETI